MMRMCTKGKSCGATCISRRKRCELELGPLVSETLTRVQSKLRPGKKSENLGDIFQGLIQQGKQEKAPSMPSDLKRQLAALGGGVAPSNTSQKATQGGSVKDVMDDISRILRGESPLKMGVGSTATGNTKWARDDAQDFDGALGKVRREGDKSYKGWEDSYRSGARKIGEGSYGTVIRNPDGTFVKRGGISDTEAALVKRLGEVDLGPKLKAADINGPATYHKENFVDVRNGRIAMSEVAGRPIGSNAKADTKFGGSNAADIYWKALADLHRMGIAHNDAHIDNILVDNKGKGRWVDLGLAQASPRAALAEAMGVFKPLKGGDDITVPSSAKGEGNWQTLKWNGTAAKEANDRFGRSDWKEFQQRFPVAARVWDNQAAAVQKLESFGLDTNGINSVIAHGIRSPLKSYNESDGFGRLTDKQAQEVLNTLYDGI